jgi:hypothetical protein
MNGRNSIYGFRGEVAAPWIILPACVMVIALLCMPGFTQVEKSIEKPHEGYAIEQPMNPGFVETLPDDIEISGIVYNIEVNVRGGKYECLILLNIMRDGTGVDINQLLYTTDPEVQSLCETAFIKDKSVHVWVKELPYEMEIEGVSYQALRVTRALL